MLKRLALSLCLLFLLQSAGSAQTLPAGKWTGFATPPGEPPLELTFDVSAGDSISILIHHPDRGDYPVSEAKLAGDTLTFWFQPGPTVRCILLKQADGSFLGDCAAEEGMSATMMMKPPVKPGG